MKINYKFSVLSKLIIFIISLLSIIATSGVLDNNFNPKIFTMFTTITNISCMLYFFVEAIYQLKNKTNKNISRIIKNILLLSITLTFLVAHFILKMRFGFNSFMNLSFLGVHYIVPILTILDFLIFDEKGKIKKYEPFIYLIMPFAYFILAIICAKLGNGLGCDNSQYPYPFLDFDALGTKTVLINCLYTKIGCLIIGYSYYIVDNLLKQKKIKKKR